MARRDEETRAAGEVAGQEPAPPGAVDWGKVGERFERDRESRLGGSPFGAEPGRQPEFTGRRTELEPAGSDVPERATEARDLGPAAPSVLRGRASVSSTQFNRPAPVSPVPPVAAPTRPAPRPPSYDASSLLLGRSEVEGFRNRWPEIKATFVDDPRASVQQADALVKEVTQTVARRLTQERERLESEWSRGSDVSTEDLRQSLHRYQTLFDRLTSST